MKNGKEMLQFRGRVSKHVYDSEDFKVYAMDIDKNKYPEIKCNNYGNVSISGDIPLLTTGVEYNIVATEEPEGRYGVSYRAVNVTRDIPLTPEDTLVFLNEVLTEKRAKVMFDNYPDIIERVRNDKMDDIDLGKLPGIGQKTLDKIKNKIIENFQLAELIGEFKGFLTMNMLRKIYEKYPSVPVLRKKLKREPYSTLTNISGVGFKTADSIITGLSEEGIIDFGYDIKTSVDRCLSCVIHLLKENEKEGNTKMNLVELRKQCYQLVPACADHFVKAVKDEGIYYDKETLDISLAKTYETERYIAETIAKNIDNDNNVWDIDVEKYRRVGEFDLSDEQMVVLNNMCKHNISILRGFAGSGKSFSTQAVISMLEDNDKSFILLAPTGKSSKVIAEYTKKKAFTIHIGLGYNPKMNEWKYNVDNKLECNVVIIDEFSMTDVTLFKRVVDAIDFEHTKLLMVGDSAQLPSVGCGNIMQDMVSSGIIPVATLNTIFRYEDGGLAKVASDTRNGKLFLNKSMKNKATAFGKSGDYVFMDLDYGDMVKKAVDAYKKLSSMNGGTESVQVLTAQNKGEYGTVALNNEIQRVVNKNFGSRSCMRIGDTVYFEGDVVIQTKNNYKAKIDKSCWTNEELMACEDEDEDPPTAFVANGESGVIKRVEKKCVYIDYNGVVVCYSKEEMQGVSLGYAITCHKSQGSSIDNVILCTSRSHTFSLNSNLIYVGLTRTKKRCLHIGSINTINYALKKKANTTRNTFMEQLLLDYANK